MVADRKTLYLSRADQQRFLEAVAAMSFWTAQQYRISHEVDDGWSLAIEGRRDGYYRAVTRGNIDDAVATAARTMMRLAKVEVPRQARFAEGR